MPEQSYQPTPDLQDVTDQSMQNNAEHNFAEPMEQWPVHRHPSQETARNDKPRKFPSLSAVTSHTSINDQNIYKNSPAQRLRSTHSPNQCFNFVASSHDLNCAEITDQSMQSSQPRNHSRNRNKPPHADEAINENTISENSFHEHNAGGYCNNYPVRTRQRELVQATANPQIAAKNKYAPLRENDRERGNCNSVHAEYQPQVAQMTAQFQQPHLPTVDNKQSIYDRDCPRNEGNFIYVNGYRLKKNGNVDPRSTLSSSETSRSKVRGPKSENFEGVERLCSLKIRVCQLYQDIL